MKHRSAADLALALARDLDRDLDRTRARALDAWRALASAWELRCALTETLRTADGQLARRAGQ
ncbi:MAG: hypothetical protein ACRDTH_01080 [Pseudonocardiaceae bacterium]